MSPVATSAPSMYNVADPSSPSITADTLVHTSGSTPQESIPTRCSSPADLMPTSGVRPDPQFNDANRYSVADDSLPMFHRKWKFSTIAGEARTSVVMLAEVAPASRSSGRRTQFPDSSFGPPRRVSPAGVQSSEAPLITSAAATSEPGAVFGTVLPDPPAKTYSATSPTSATSARAAVGPTIAVVAATIPAVSSAQVGSSVDRIVIMAPRRVRSGVLSGQGWRRVPGCGVRLFVGGR